MLQHLTVMYRLSYIIWLQLAAEFGGCSLCILTSPLTMITISPAKYNLWSMQTSDLPPARLLDNICISVTNFHLHLLTNIIRKAKVNTTTCQPYHV